MPPYKKADLVAQLRGAISEATTTVGRLRRTAGFLEVCERELESSDRLARYHVFHEISYGFSERPNSSRAAIWDWLQEIAQTADLERQVDMRIGVFELVPAPPIIWSDFYRLWDMWFAPQTRWAVYAAYFPFPRRVRQHLRRYSAHRRRSGLPVPEFSADEFRDVLSRHPR